MAAIDLPAAVYRWKLSGPSGPELDAMAAGLINAGLGVECIEPRASYRVAGDAVELSAIAEQVASVDGFALGVELPTPGPVNLRARVQPARPFRRTVYVHGQGEAAFGYVARAVDARLSVAADGVSCWAVTGRTADLLAWLSEHVHKATLDDVLALWRLTREQVAAEDADLGSLPPIRIVMPDRVIKTQKIVRDNDGEIVEVLQSIKQVGDDETQQA